MSLYQNMSKKELLEKESELLNQYRSFQAENLSLDMSRGKPNSEQLNLSNDLFLTVNEETGFFSDNGFDCRNYGIVDGLPECKKILADILDVTPEQLIVGGNSSLNLIFDYLTQCMLHGSDGKPWHKNETIKFICPVPGYDRHFMMLDYLGIEMIPVPLLSDGPDMAEVEKLISDPSVKGLICVPKYSNPTGITFSDDKVRALAAMKPTADDFRIIWDNAYCVHDLNDTPDELLNIMTACEAAGNPDMVIQVMSTSKITFPGSGVSALTASKKNIEYILKRMNMQTIGYDKLNQLRHVRFLKNADGIHQLMKKHAEFLRPKFETVLSAFNEEFTGKDIASWTVPNGGYFISIDLLEGCAKQVVLLCKQAGVVLTPAGATFPGGNDPKDSNIRIAPTYPSTDELRKAVELFCICVELVSVQKIIAEL